MGDFNKLADAVFKGDLAEVIKYEMFCKIALW
jgi:hypothetical protein